MTKTIVWMLRILGILTSLFALLYFSSDQIVVNSLEKSKKLETIFQAAVEKVASFEKNNSRLPTGKEFEMWRDELSEEFGLYAELLMYNKGSSFRDEVILEFGSPKGDVFLLSIWRGEWQEYYSSWAKRSTLPKSKAEYSITGNFFGDIFSLVLLAFVFFSTAQFLNQKISHPVIGPP